ncbi:hypothetical protein ACEWY4_011027 [Coilia grayii]|uniref:Proline rich 33 n=1 Tax=Coilia grayii TaxID=363190 RepID=A0ABD1K3J9_9TELE
MSYRVISSPGLLSQQYRPPLLPKPGKDNARLQKLLKKSAKKKAAQQAQQMAIPFRSSLSPVNEASPDLERSDHSTPPKTPETPFYSATLHPRFNIRPLYQHVASPYPHHRSFTYPNTAKLSPQPYVAPSQIVARSVTPRITYTPPPRLRSASPGPATYAEAHMLHGGTPTYPATSLPSAPVPAVALASKTRTVPVPEPAPVAVAAPAPTISMTSTEPVKTAEPSKLLVPTTVVIQKTPSPKFHVFDATRPPRPMFEVPQITIYTAKTSYYETETAPLHDSSGGRLSYYGRSPSPRARSRTPTPDTRQGTSPIRFLTPASDIRGRVTPTSEIRGRTLEVKRGPTPTSDLRGRTTPVIEIKRGATPTSEVRGRPTSNSEIRGRPMPISEVKRVTTPTSDMRGTATPTSDLKKEYVEGRRSKTPTPQSVSGEVSQKPLETGQPKVSIPNGDVKVTLVTSTTKIPTEDLSKPEASLLKTRVKEAPEPSPPTTAPQPATSVTSAVSQKPITSIQEASKPDTPKTVYPQLKVDDTASSPPAGFSKPKSAQSQAQALKPIFGQRPKTPIHGGMKSTPRTYYGLTPAAYVAHGGIQTIAPSFSVSRPKTPTAELPKPEEKMVPEKQMPLQEAPKSEVPNEQKSKTTVAEIPAQITPSTETKAPVGAKPQGATKTSVSEAKTKPVPVVDQTKPQVTEVKETKSPATSAVPKPFATQTQKDKAAISGPPTPKTPTSEAKTARAEKQIAALFSKAKTSEKGSDETKKQDAISKTVNEQTEVPKEPAKPKDTALETSKTKASGAQLISSILSSKPKISERPESDKTEAQPVAKTKDKPADEAKPIKEAKADTQAGEQKTTAPTEEKKEKEESTLPEAESLLKVVQKPKGAKSKLSGWSRLKKHMVVEVEEPKFPEAKPDSATEPKKDIPNGKVPKLAAKEEAPASSQQKEGKDAPRATMMWDAVLFQMFSSKENIMQQIIANKSEEEKKEMEEKAADKSLEIPAFAHRLPVLLFSPKFDAKKLREAASRPVTKMSTVFEMGLIGRKTKDEEPKQFNRTAKGFSTSKPTEA